MTALTSEDAQELIAVLEEYNRHQRRRRKARGAVVALVAVAVVAVGWAVNYGSTSADAVNRSRADLVAATAQARAEQASADARSQREEADHLRLIDRCLHADLAAILGTGTGTPVSVDPACSPSAP